MGFNVMDIGQCLGSSKKCIVCKYLGICRVMVLQNESNIANTSSSEQVETNSRSVSSSVVSYVGRYFKPKKV